MTGQLQLFENAAEPDAQSSSETKTSCHRGDPQTSVLAGIEFHRSGKAARHRELILDAMKRYGPGTHSEIARNIPELDWLAVARRLSELQRDGLIVRGPARVCTIKGSKCSVWRLTEGGD